MAQAADVHSTDNCVVFGKCCRGSAVTGVIVFSAVPLVPEPRVMTSSGGGQSQWCARIWLWGPVAGASVGELMVAGAQVVGRPRKAAKAKTNNGSLLKLMSIELVMLSNI